MSFAESLERVVTGAEGAVAGMIIGFDGLPVETFSREGSSLDLEDVGVELTARLRDLLQLTTVLGIGDVEEFQIRTTESTLLVRILNEDYCLLLAFTSTKQLGRGRYLLRTIVPQVRAELG